MPVKMLAPRVKAADMRRITKSAGTGRDSGLYDYQWQKRRLRQLQEHPLCAMCQAKTPPRVTLARIADHIVPHRGDLALFAGPLQSLCRSCHSSAKQREEWGG